MINRIDQIKKKGFQMNLQSDTNERYTPTDFNKIKIGLKTLDDAIVNYGTYNKINPNMGNKQHVLKAINNGDITELRQISNFFYKTSGIYARLCRYMAYLYKYDWFITPYIEECQGLLDADSGISDTTIDEKEEKRSTEAEDRKMNETTSEKAETAPKATSSAWADAVQNAMRAIDKE